MKKRVTRALAYSERISFWSRRIWRYRFGRCRCGAAHRRDASGRPAGAMLARRRRSSGWRRSWRCTRGGGGDGAGLRSPLRRYQQPGSRDVQNRSGSSAHRSAKDRLGVPRSSSSPAYERGTGRFRRIRGFRGGPGRRGGREGTSPDSGGFLRRAPTAGRKGGTFFLEETLEKKRPGVPLVKICGITEPGGRRTRRRTGRVICSDSFSPPPLGRWSSRLLSESGKRRH